MTRPDHPSGSDRIYEALGKLDPGGRGRDRGQSAGRLSDHPARQYPRRAGAAGRPRGRYRNAGRRDPHRGGEPEPERGEGGRLALGARRLRALYFTRATAPWGDGPRYHHIGLYAYRRAALERFVALPPSPLERQEKLEQLRALEAGMRIDVTIVDTVPRGVDTPADLETARRILAKSLSGCYKARHDQDKTRLRRSRSRASRAPIPTSPSPRPIPTPSRCPARPSRTRSPRSPRGKPISA